MPGFGVSVWTSLVPVILMAMRAVAEMVLPKGHAFLPIAEFFGDPVVATLIAVLIAMFTFGLNRGRSMEQINDTLTSSIKIIAMMLLIIGGGAFKQVLVDSGMDKYIASIVHESICPRCLWHGRLLRYCVSRWVPPPLRRSPRRYRRAADRHHRREPGTDGDRRWLRQRYLLPLTTGLLAV